MLIVLINIGIEKMKIAIVCDWLITIGGAEKVLNNILECFPEADLFAIIDFIPTNKRGFLKNKKVTTTFVQKLPLAKRLYRLYLPIMPFAIEQLDLSKYDVIISSSHAISKGVITTSDQLHICYCHTPMRYAWDLYNEYLNQKSNVTAFNSILTRFFLYKLRFWDVKSVNLVDYFVANSYNIAKRIKKNYNRNATVIYPPVKVNSDISVVIDNKESRDFYLAASRLVSYKKIALIVSTFLKIARENINCCQHLVVIGDGPEFKRIKQLAKNAKNIILLGYVDDNVLIKYFKKSKALIFAANEDFGMLPVEALSYGTPIIAYKKGGLIEIINQNNKKTGYFFDIQNEDAIIKAIKEFENSNVLINPVDCFDSAQLFKENIFKEKFKDFINKKILEHDIL